MAIIYSYPEIPDVQGGDLLLISDTGAPNKPTRSVDIDDQIGRASCRERV